MGISGNPTGLAGSDALSSPGNVILGTFEEVASNSWLGTIATDIIGMVEYAYEGIGEEARSGLSTCTTAWLAELILLGALTTGVGTVIGGDPTSPSS